jgi:hypothetical protein
MDKNLDRRVGDLETKFKVAVAVAAALGISGAGVFGWLSKQYADLSRTQSELETRQKKLREEFDHDLDKKAQDAITKATPEVLRAGVVSTVQLQGPTVTWACAPDRLVKTLFVSGEAYGSRPPSRESGKGDTIGFNVRVNGADWRSTNLYVSDPDQHTLPTLIGPLAPPIDNGGRCTVEILPLTNTAFDKNSHFIVALLN